MFRNKSVDTHKFAMVPRADIPRSSFQIETAHKTTFDAGYLIPYFATEVLPGDTFNLNSTIFARLATPLFPVMDNMSATTFFFFVPNRILWTNWVKFMGEQTNPADSISYVCPTSTSPVGGYAVGSLQDYLGLPTVGQVGGANTFTHNTFHLRAYNKIWNNWFRSEDLQNSLTEDTGDGPDTVTNYTLQRRGKRFDYFTSCLPWPQKGGVAISVPLGTSATVKTSATDLITGAQNPLLVRTSTAGAAPLGSIVGAYANTHLAESLTGPTGERAPGALYPTNLFADLTTATAATINQLRQSFQIQKLLERDARGGTRYAEIVRSHFGVISPDARLQRPEYLGGSTFPINISPIAQTSGTSASGTTTPLGTLASMGTALGNRNGFSASFTEHGVILGLISIQADLTYQQGLRKMWSRSTRYDFYFPAFAHLGEQAVLNKEIYLDGSANDALVFGYQERWGEYRYQPTQITGLFKSTSAGTIDGWHLAQKFTSLPTLNSTFIQDTPPVSRVVAVGAAANGQQFIFDSLTHMRVARPLPMYSVPGLIDHF